jgi:hypothetical protein
MQSLQKAHESGKSAENNSAGRGTEQGIAAPTAITTASER